MTITVNNFTGLNLNNLENSILTNSYELRLFCKNFNSRTVQLETPEGSIVALGEGFSIIPILRELSKEKFEIGCKLPFSPEIIDTNLDFQILYGATVTISLSNKENEVSSLLVAVVKDRNGEFLFSVEETKLSTILSKIEAKFIEQEDS